MDPLRAMMQRGNTQAARQWLMALPCPEVRDPETGETALHVLAEFDAEVLFRQQLRRMPMPDILDEFGRGPSHVAAINNHPAHLHALASARADMDMKGLNGNAPIHDAALHRAIDAICALHRAQANLTAKDCCGDTAGHLVIEGPRCLRTLHTLLQCGADPDAQNMHGDTLLHCAVAHNFVQAIPLLHHYGARTGIRNHQGLTADLVRTGNGSNDSAAAAAVMRERFIRTIAAHPREESC